VGKMLRSKKAS